MTKPKRPRDPNQLAKMIVSLSVGESTDADPDSGKDPKAIARGKRGGAKGGKARAERLTAEQRAASARKAARSRWKND